MSVKNEQVIFNKRQCSINTYVWQNARSYAKKGRDKLEVCITCRSPRPSTAKAASAAMYFVKAINQTHLLVSCSSLKVV